MQTQFFFKRQPPVTYKPCLEEIRLTTYLNSGQKNAAGFTYFSWCEKNKSYFDIQ
jgi:hypothetical protein